MTGKPETVYPAQRAVPRHGTSPSLLGAGRGGGAYRGAHAGESLLGPLRPVGLQRDGEGARDVAAELDRDAHRLRHEQRCQRATPRPTRYELRRRPRRHSTTETETTRYNGDRGDMVGTTVTETIWYDRDRDDTLQRRPGQHGTTETETTRYNGDRNDAEDDSQW